MAAIANGDAAAAERAMHDHIHISWERRRLPDHAPGSRTGQPTE
ncbi:hypothetical protein ACRAWC_25285 [Leifsonia sp. L25]